MSNNYTNVLEQVDVPSSVVVDAALTSLDVLESEAIHIIREVVAEFERPALLFS
nr:sulfate adenylyltransferase small subunit [Acidobacteriota bacterium]